MGIDPAQLSSGIAAIQAEATDPNPTLETLTVTGASVLDGLTVEGSATFTDTVTMLGLPTEDPQVEGELFSASGTDVITLSHEP